MNRSSWMESSPIEIAHENGKWFLSLRPVFVALNPSTLRWRVFHCNCKVTWKRAVWVPAFCIVRTLHHPPFDSSERVDVEPSPKIRRFSDFERSSIIHPWLFTHPTHFVSASWRIKEWKRKISLDVCLKTIENYCDSRIKMSSRSVDTWWIARSTLWLTWSFHAHFWTWFVWSTDSHHTKMKHWKFQAEVLNSRKPFLLPLE